MNSIVQVTYIPKVATEDTALTTQDAAGNKVIVPVPQGATVVLDVAALHYNRTSSDYVFIDVCHNSTPDLQPGTGRIPMRLSLNASMATGLGTRSFRLAMVRAPVWVGGASHVHASLPR